VPPDTLAAMKNILISGAGIAGPALAYWLTRHGFRPTVVERAPEPRDGGYAVDFRGEVHLAVLRRMGLLAAVEEARTNMGPMSYVNSAGRRIATMPADMVSGDLEILRGDLARILYDATKDDAEYLFGDTVTGVSQEDGQVTFEHARPRTFDLVVGADGLHSGVRSLVFGPEKDFLTETGLYCAIFTMANELNLDYAGLAHNTPGRLVAVYSARKNTEAKAMLWFGSPPLPRQDRGQQRTTVAEAFAGVGWETPRLLEAMWSAPDFYFDSISQVHLPRWSRGRCVLLGDAAYCPSPLSGMGNGLAIVGAYVLAGELAAAAGDHTRAFAAYESAMRDYATGCQKLGQGVADWMVPRTRFRTWFVNQNYKLLPYLPGKSLLANKARKVASGITLEDY
jgi:2-polyprenyl-6-methoxyphenol hydroxylase-like FAD-dependent oxidoreductase